MKKKKKGFTLVELLAVIVILAVILIIAVPRISEVINNSKKASFEATAKTIANQAEKKYMENEVLGKTGSFECSDVVKINNTDYASCTINFDTNGNALVSMTGSGKFAGLTIKNATKNSATATELTATDSKYFSYELQADGLTEDESKIYDVTVVDQDKCIVYMKNMNVPEEQATTICNGGIVGKMNLGVLVSLGRIPASDYENAGLKVDIYNKSVDVIVADQDRCVTYVMNLWNDTSDEGEQDATKLCNGEVVAGETLNFYVKIDDIPESDYETAGLNVKDVYKLYDVTVSDQSKCVAYYKNLGETEEDATTFCNGGVINGDTLANDVKNGYIPASHYEAAGLKVTSKVYDKSTIIITGYNVAGGLDVVIPSYIDGKKVVAIAEYAFCNLALSTVAIPSSVTSIGNNAFESNPNMVITNNSSVENVKSVWDKILGLDGVCSPKMTITNNIIEIGIKPVC